jgi:hypothetical protein
MFKVKIKVNIYYEFLRQIFELSFLFLGSWQLLETKT